MKAHEEAELQLHAFTLALDGGVGVSFTSLPLYLRTQGPWHPLNKELGGVRGRCEH